MSKRMRSNSNLNISDIVYGTADGKLSKSVSSDPWINKYPMGVVTSTSPLCTMTLGNPPSSGNSFTVHQNYASFGCSSATFSASTNSSCSTMSSSTFDAFKSNCYYSMSDFIYDVVSNQLLDKFCFSDQCLIDVVKELIDNPNMRSFISLHMPILMLKSNNISVFVFDLVIKKMESDK